jgi:hypothetical protein
MSGVCFSQEIDIPASQSKTYYEEILIRTPFNVSTEHERATNAHENIHMINAHYANKTGGKKRAFYITGEKGVFLTVWPKIKKDDVRQFVPLSVRGYRYANYLNGAKEWNNQPLYILDEWSAYVGGGMVALEDHQNGINRDRSDRMSGALEFSIYSTALCMTIEQQDPEFWKNNKEFRGFVGKMIDKSKKLFYTGRHIKDFESASQEKLLDALRNAEDAKELRDFLEEHFNGAFLY